MEKWQKIVFTQTDIILKVNKLIGSNFDMTTLKPVNKSCYPLILSFEPTDKQLVGERHDQAKPSRTGPVHHAYRLHGQRETFFIP